MTKKQKMSLKYEPISEAQKDPEFRREIKKFIKATTRVYNLKDYGLD